MVRADKADANDIFDKKVHYEIPPFQRPYVWDEEHQWRPLWEDITRVAESHLRGNGQVISSHFMGAVVVELNEATSTGVNRFDVIDGQQRLTTMQLLLGAAEHVLRERGHDDEAESLEDLTRNKLTKLNGTPQRFKLWPSITGRDAFAAAMDPAVTPPGDSNLITEAYQYFRNKISDWLQGVDDDHDDPIPGDEASRAEELTATLIRRLLVVSIDISEEDDPQLIFETLNDRGTPLLKADLIKNWIFREGDRLGADVHAWATKFWNDFDDDWWRQEIAQGRASRPRVDIFLQYWLTLRTLGEVKTDLVFKRFTEYSKDRMSTVAEAEAYLTELRNDAKTYRGIADLDPTTPRGRFNAQVIEAMEQAATMPVFLWFVSDNHQVPDDQVEIGLAALESWVTRRTLLRFTTKDVNRFMIVILRELDEVPQSEAGIRLREFLAEQESDTRLWPRDSALREGLSRQRLYGNVKGSRIVAVLAAVEHWLRERTPMPEQIAVPSRLTLEHIMPRGWRTHWNPEPKLSEEDSAKRDVLVDTIGNLTLATGSLNSSLRHRPWTDGESATLKEGGQAGKGKRSLLNAYSLLMINKRIIDDHPDAWTEDDIRARGAEIADQIIAVWPGPDEPAKAQA